MMRVRGSFCILIYHNMVVGGSLRVDDPVGDEAHFCKSSAKGQDADQESAASNKRIVVVFGIFKQPVRMHGDGEGWGSQQGKGESVKKSRLPFAHEGAGGEDDECLSAGKENSEESEQKGGPHTVLQYEEREGFVGVGKAFGKPFESGILPLGECVRT